MWRFAAAPRAKFDRDESAVSTPLSDASNCFMSQRYFHHGGDAAMSPPRQPRSSRSSFEIRRSRFQQHATRVRIDVSHHDKRRATSASRTVLQR